MATTVTIAGVEVDYQDFRIDVPLSPIDLAPKAEIELAARGESITAGDPVTITIDGTTAFDGTARTSGKIREDGRRTVPCDHDGIDLFQEQVSFTTTGTDEDVLRDALEASSRGSDFSLTFNATTAGLANDYEADDRPLKRVFRDMMDRGRNVWWVDPASNSITVEPLGERGQWKALDAQADAVNVRSFDPGDIASVRNVVTVVGTGDVAVNATKIDADSVDEFGRQPAAEPFNFEYVTDPLEAEELADALIIPDPLASGEIIVGKNVGDVVQPLSNFTVALDDASKGISETGLVVEKQTIRQGRATLQIGEGSGVNFDNVNRGVKSTGDNSKPGSTYDSDRIADGAIEEAKLVDTSVTEAKLADLAVATGKLQDSAVINGKLSDLSVSETKIQDDSIATPKLQAEAVTANEIEADTITAAEIAAGTITALEVATDTLTADEIAAGTITALEIASDTITANNIDTLSLDTNQVDIGADSAYYKFNTEIGASGETAIVMEPDGPDGLGFVGNPFGSQNVSIYSDTISSMAGIEPNGGDNTGNIGTSSAAYADIYAHNYVTASPDPIDGVDCGGLCNIDWYDNPPEPVRQRARDIGDTDDEVPDGRDHTPVELATMSNWLLEAVKSLNEKVDRLEGRIEELETDSQ